LTLVIGTSFIVVKVFFSPKGAAPFCRSSYAIAAGVSSIVAKIMNKTFFIIYGQGMMRY
jgi:hypothetical protein